VRLAGCEVVSELGRGGQGVVYRVRDLATGADRALKVLSGDPDPESVVRFRREAEALARLEAHGVVPVHRSGVEGGRLYFVMDLMPRGSLQSRLAERGPLPWREAATLALTLARTLARAAALGLVHRDLKPANVLFDDSGEARITDFGCVRDLGASRLTETGTVLGTPAYMAPEQLEGLPVDGRADVFALGVVLHEMLTGTRPYPGKTAVALHEQARSGARPRASSVSDCPRKVDDVLDRALAFDPAGRSTASDIASELEAILGGRAHRAPAGGRLVLGALVLLAAGIAATVVVVSPRSERPPPPTTPSAPPTPGLPHAPPPPPPARLTPEKVNQLLANVRVEGGLAGLDDVAAVWSACSADDRARILGVAFKRLRTDVEAEAAPGISPPLRWGVDLIERGIRLESLAPGDERLAPVLMLHTLLGLCADQEPAVTRAYVRLAALTRTFHATRPDDVRQILESTAEHLGNRARNKLDLEEALALARKFEEAGPDSPWPPCVRGRLLLSEKSSEAERLDGLSALRTAISRYEEPRDTRAVPESVTYCLGCAKHAGIALRVDEERAIYQLIVARAPGSFTARRILADFLLQQDDLDEAFDQHLRARKAWTATDDFHRDRVLEELVTEGTRDIGGDEASWRAFLAVRPESDRVDPAKLARIHLVLGLAGACRGLDGHPSRIEQTCAILDRLARARTDDPGLSDLATRARAATSPAALLELRAAIDARLKAELNPR
jgi:serine/threonine-protein kinase